MQNQAETGHSEHERDTLSADGKPVLCACRLCAHIRLTNPPLFKQCGAACPQSLGELGREGRGKIENRDVETQSGKGRGKKKRGAVDLTQPR